MYTIKKISGKDTITIADTIISLPDKPLRKEMVNFGVPKKNQKFVTRSIPEDIASWETNKIDEYVAREWHIRRNGYWILIKGEPFYITGTADLFFNYWWAEKGGLPDFRMEALEFFTFWWFCENDPDCFGMLDIKCRRLGDTEKALCCVWDRSTRHLEAHAGLQHITEKGAGKNFRRLVKANFKMPFFYRPMNTGTDKPKKKLEFDIPEERLSLKKIREQQDEIRVDVEVGLGSNISFEPAYTGAFDGDRLYTYYMDETFKIKQARLDIRAQLNNIQECTSLNNGEKIIGKSFYTSTVEEMEDGGTVVMAQELWDDSDQNNKEENGRTISGLYRYFRGFQCAAEVDEWGFHKVEEATKKRDLKIQILRKNKKWKKLISVYRKSPSDIDEALSAPMEECVLYPELCEERLNQIKRNEGRFGQKVDEKGRPFFQKGGYGNLHWKDNVIGGEVVWVPHDNGRWYISKHPDYPNRYNVKNGRKVPANMFMYRMGCDPFDSTTIQGQGSDGAFTVKERFNQTKEDELQYDQNGGIVNVENAKTNVYVCDYSHRHRNPYDFYMDVYMTCHYYGVQVFLEMDKPGCDTWFRNNKHERYLQNKPMALRNSGSKKNETGSAARPQTIEQYVSALQMYIHDWIWACNHPRLITNWKRFTVKNRTKFDLAVASGFTELADYDNRFDKSQKEDTWTESIYDN